MRTVGDILSAAKGSFISLRPEATVYEALNTMAQHNVGAIVVADGRRLVGVFSERDFTRKVLLNNRTPEQTQLKEVMTSNVVSVTPDISAEECLSRMNRRGVRHLPVVKQGEVIGFVSILEVVDAVLALRETMISRLERYVSETWPI
ncbi:MAG: CBS domain-containing protein [Bdellovibrionales bacterium]